MNQIECVCQPLKYPSSLSMSSLKYPSSTFLSSPSSSSSSSSSISSFQSFSSSSSSSSFQSSSSSSSSYSPSCCSCCCCGINCKCAATIQMIILRFCMYRRDIRKYSSYGIFYSFLIFQHAYMHILFVVHSL